MTIQTIIDKITLEFKHSGIFTVDGVSPFTTDRLIIPQNDKTVLVVGPFQECWEFLSIDLTWEDLQSKIADIVAVLRKKAVSILSLESPYNSIPYNPSVPLDTFYKTLSRLLEKYIWIDGSDVVFTYTANAPMSRMSMIQTPMGMIIERMLK